MTEYFSHDYKARNDPKLVRLMMRHGITGIGAFWCITEMLYENKGYVDISEYERIAFELRTDTKFIASVIQDFNLFKFKNQKFYSKTVLLRLKKRSEKSEKARQSVISRWTKNKPVTDTAQTDTNVLPTQNEPTTNKTKNKENKNIENIPSPLPSPAREKPDEHNPQKGKKKEKSCAKKERNTIPPTFEMVALYCQQRNNNINPQTFIDHYDAKGWLIGKEAMVDWQATIRTWEQKNNKQQTNKPKKYGNA